MDQEVGGRRVVHYVDPVEGFRDTAQALEMRDVLDEVGRGLRGIVATVAELATVHRDTLMIGRTHARPALPTTFGLKVAGWADEWCARPSAWRRCGAGCWWLSSTAAWARWRASIGGARAGATVCRAAGAGVADIGWHVARDRVAEYLSNLAMLARIADEVRTLGRPEFAELTEGWRYGKMGSSTMPHKRNPEACEQVVALAD